MHILFFTHYYPPEVNAPATRTHDHASVWMDRGHKVTVVCAAPNHPKGELFPGYRNRGFQRETIDGVDVIRIWTFITPNAGFFKRSLSHLSYLLSVLFWSWKLPRADIVVATSPQFFSGVAGLFFQRPNRPWVLEIRDIWSEALPAVGIVKNSLPLRLLEKAERFLARRADLVVTVTNRFYERLRQDRPDGPMIIIRNGVLGDRFQWDNKAVKQFRADHGLTDKYVVSYIGTHGMAARLSTVIEAAKRMANDPTVHFLLVGEGAEKDALKSARDAAGLTNITMLDQQPKSMIPTIWRASDATMVLLRGSPEYQSVLPSKMFEAMAAERPIILGVAGEARDLLDEAKAGIGITPESVDELVAAIETLRADPKKARRFGLNGRAFYADQVDRRVLATRMAEAMEQLVP